MNRNKFLTKIIVLVSLVILGIINFIQINKIADLKKQNATYDKNIKRINTNVKPRAKCANIIELLNKNFNFKITDVHNENDGILSIKVESNKDMSNLYNELKKVSEIPFFNDFNELRIEKSEDDNLKSTIILNFNRKI